MSLKNCLNRAGKAVDAKAIRQTYQTNLVNGLDEDTAALGAVRGYLASLESERESVLEQIRAQGGEVMEPEAEPTPVVQASRAPVFRSLLAEAVEKHKQAAMPAKMWSQWIEKSAPQQGVKKDEILWSGVREWLETRGTEKVSREDVATWLRANGVQVTEVQLDDAAPSAIPLDASGYQITFDAFGEEVEYLDPNGNAIQFDDLPEDVQARAEELLREGEPRRLAASAGKYARYQLPGGTSYRELLLTLPASEGLIAEKTLGDLDQQLRRRGYSGLDSAAKATLSRPDNEAFEFLDDLEARLDIDVAQARAELMGGGDNTKAFRSRHWDQPNVLAHVRFNERTDAEGRRILFLEELQSDWAQEGRKEGFQDSSPRTATKATRLPAGFWEVFDQNGDFLTNVISDVTETEALAIANQRLQNPEIGQIRDRGRIPRGPFVQDTKAWTALALKRMIRYAVDNGFQGVAWTTGAQQADRYNLSKAVRRVEYTSAGRLMVEGERGSTILNKEVPESEIAQYVGKEAAERLLQQTPRYHSGLGSVTDKSRWITGDGLRMGGEGMTAFYDGIVPQVARDLLKKFGGADVLQLDVQFPPQSALYPNQTERREPRPQPGFAITDKLAESASQGLPLFSRAPSVPPRRPGGPGGNSLPPPQGPNFQQRGPGQRPGINVVENQISPDVQPETERNWRDRVLLRVNKALDSPLSGLIQEREYRTIRGLTHGRLAEVDTVVRQMYDLFRKANEADAKAIYNWLVFDERNSPLERRINDTTTMVEDGGRPSLGMISDPKLRDATAYIKSTFERIGEELVGRGLISEAAFEKYRGAYLPRMYLAYMLDEQVGAEIGAGKTPSLDRFKQRGDLDAFTRKYLLGEITDPAVLIAKGFGQEMRAIALIDWLNEIAKNKNWVLQSELVEFNGQNMTVYALEKKAAQLEQIAEFMDPLSADRTRDTARQMREAAAENRAQHQVDHDVLERYRRIPDTAKYGNLRGLAVLKEVYDDIMGGAAVGEGETWVEKAFGVGGPAAQKAIGWWKFSMVAANPASHVRNFISNGVLLHLSGVPFLKVPVRLAQSVSAIFDEKSKYRRYYDLANKYGLFSSTFASQEIPRIDREFMDFLIRSGGFEEAGIAGKAWIRLKARALLVAGKMSDAYQANEAVWKTAAVIDAVEGQGLSDAEAAAWADKALFDYSDVSRSVRALRTSAYGVPFATFQSKGAARMAEVALKRPWAFAPYVAFFYGVTQALASLFDVDDDDVEALKKALPKWMEEKGHTALLPWKDAEGRWQIVDLGYFLPWVQMYSAAKSLTSGDASSAAQTVGLFSTPIATGVTAITTGIDPFTDLPIVNEYDSPAKKMASVTGYLIGLTLPSMVSRTLPVIEDAATGELNREGLPGPTMGQALTRLAGVNIYGVDPVRSRAENLKAMEYEMSRLKARRTALLKNPNLDRDERREIVDTYRKMIQMQAEKIVEYEKSSRVNPRLR
jgi:hypothetical protein